MKKLFIIIFVLFFAALSSFAQYTTNYYDQYGQSTGSAKTQSNYGGGVTTTYYDQYGRIIGTKKTKQ